MRAATRQSRLALHGMRRVRARAQNGRLIVDEATSLPEGAVIDIVLHDEGGGPESSECLARDAALFRAWEQAQRCEGRPARSVLDDLRGR